MVLEMPSDLASLGKSREAKEEEILLWSSKHLSPTIILLPINIR